MWAGPSARARTLSLACCRSGWGRWFRRNGGLYCRVAANVCDATEMIRLESTKDTSTPHAPAGRGWLYALLDALVVLIAAGWRLMGIGPAQLWHDEVCTIWYMRASWPDLLLRLPWSDNHSPLSFALFKLWGLAGMSEPWLRLQSVLFGVATVAFIIAWVRMIEPRAAWFAGLIAAVSPMLVHYSQELRMYPLMVLCVAAGFYFAERSVHSGRCIRDACWMAFCAVVGGHLHAVGLAIFPMLVTYWLIRHGGLGISRRAAAGITAGWLVCVLPMVWLSIHWSGMGHRYGWWIPSPDARTFEAVGDSFLGLDLVSRWEGHSTDADKMWWAFGAERILLFLPPLLLGLAPLKQCVRGAVGAMLAASLVYVAILVLGSRLALPVLIARTALPALVPLLAAAGLGFGGGRRAASAGVLAIGLVWVVLLGGLWVWTVYRGPERRGVDYAACDYIRRSAGPDDVIVCAPYWVEYSVAHHLRDAIQGGQLIGSCYPAFAGKPVQLRLGNRLEDPRWLDRLMQALQPATGERRGGGGGSEQDMSVWLVQYGLLGGITPTGTSYANEIAKCGFKSVESRVFGVLRPLVVTRFRRAGAVSRS
jgi:hypothetical protein